MAGDLAAGREVLEVGCGSGMGLAYLATRATRAVGIELTPALLEDARQHLPGVELHMGDAQELPFPDGAFDVVLMLEMIYYLPNVDRAVAECRRVLRQGGVLMVCEPNPDRPDFNPSAFAVRYLDVRDLSEILDRHGFAGTIYGGFPVEARSLRGRFLQPLRHFAIRLHLVPRSMRGKAMVKRFLYGRLPRLGAVNDQMAEYVPPTKLDPADWPQRSYVNLYAIGRLPS
jgi:SAM-dependent methyltransferase